MGGGGGGAVNLQIFYTGVVPGGGVGGAGGVEVGGGVPGGGVGGRPPVPNFLIHYFSWVGRCLGGQTLPPIRHRFMYP